MDFRRFQLPILSTTIAISMVLQTVTIGFAEDGILTTNLTVPVEHPILSSTTDLLQSMSEGKPFHNIIDYLGYKNITVDDMVAIKWSFILSQMATPLEESLEDVLNSDIVVEMKTKNLKISSMPESMDKDYSYNQLDTDFEVESYEFAKVHETITKNMRYSRLFDSTGNQFTLKSFYNNVRRKESVGYISDYIYTNRSNTTYDEMTQLPDRVESLYSYDDVNNASNLVDYWKNPEKLIREDGKDRLVGQRRFVPVFVGSNLTDFYLQLGMMCYCKRNADSGITYQKFIDDFGTSELWVDSFGNIVFYDSSSEKYKMILPNACNPVFTTTESTSETVPLFSEDYLSAIEELSTSEGINTITYTEEDLIENLDVDLWSERGFMYNKWLGAVYSTKRRTSTEEEDPTQYYFNDNDDLERAYYPAYLGPLVDSRTDYRNSVVLTRPIRTFLNPLDVTKFVNVKKNLWKDFLNIFCNYSTGAVTVPFDNGNEPTVYNDISGYYKDDGEYLPMSTVLFNTILAEGDKASKTSSNGSMSSYSVYIMYTMAQLCDALLMQTASDTVLPTLSDMELVQHKGGGIAQFIPSNALVDVENEDLLGSEGGFLRENKNILLERYQEKIPGWLDAIYKGVVYGLSGNLAGADDGDDNELVKVESSDYSIDFQTKIDNRISNRFVNVPSDDYAILSYVWLNDYLNKIVFTKHYKDSDSHTAVKNYIEKNSHEATENYTDNYLLLPFNVTSVKDQTYELTTCMLPLQNADDAGNFYRYADGKTDLTTIDKDGNKIDYKLDTPCTNRASINSYALIMGLYKNTDTQFNITNSIQVIETDREVSVAELSSKLDFSMSNPISVFVNVLSGILQYVHNAIAVKVSSYYTIMMNSETFTNVKFVYLMYVAVTLVTIVVIQGFKYVFKRTTLVGGFKSVAFSLILMLSVPILFIGIQNTNRFIMAKSMQTTVDRTTLVSVQKNIDGLINTESKAEKNWKVYRQQFSNLSDVFDDGYVSIPVGYKGNEVEYQKVKIDDLVRQIKYLGAGTDTTGVNDNKWYEVPYTEDSYPLYSRYNSDVTKYFYDNILGNYMNYYSDKLSTDQGLIVSQYTAIPSDDLMEKTKVTDRLDRIIHTLKGGYTPLLHDSDYLNTHDVLGIARFFNQPVVNPYSQIAPEEKQNISLYLPLVESNMRSKEQTKLNTTEKGELYLPYTTKGLEIQTKGERNKFDYVYRSNPERKNDYTDFEEVIIKINRNSLYRIKQLVKFRPGEFSDTALIYTSAMIIVDELVSTVSDLEYSVPSISDMDKMLRLIICDNTEDIYNSEAVMYIVQDTVTGGAVLSIVVVAIELMVTVGNLLTILICAIASLLMPIMIKRYYDGVNVFYRHQLLGVIFQLVVSSATLYVINLPFSLGSTFANKPLGDFNIWLFFIICFLIELFAFKVIFSISKLIVKDFAAMGGSIIADRIDSMMHSGQLDATVDYSNQDIHDVVANAQTVTVTGSEDIDSIEDELRIDERQGLETNDKKLEEEYMEENQSDDLEDFEFYD